MRLIEDRMMPLMLLLLLSNAGLRAATFMVHMTAPIPPSYYPSHFASFILEDPPLLTSSNDYHEYTFEAVNVSSPVFTPLSSYQVTLAYFDSSYFPDGFSLRIHGPFRETAIVCGNGFQSWGVVCGPLVYRRHEYDLTTGMWQSQLDLMRTLQNTPTMQMYSDEMPSVTFGGSNITLEETPEPSTLVLVASAMALHLRRQRRYSIRQ